MRPEAIEALRDSESDLFMLVTSATRKCSSASGLLHRQSLFAGTSTPAAWAQSLPLSDVVEVGELQLYVLHDLTALDLDPYTAQLAAVICGHSHRPNAELRKGVALLEPGQCRPAPLLASGYRRQAPSASEEVFPMSFIELSV